VPVLHLVPFRSGSKGIHQKSLRKVNGTSLAARAVKYGLGSKIHGPTFVSSDSRRMLRLVLRELGHGMPRGLALGGIVQVAEGLFLHFRQPEFALDGSPLGPLFAEAVKGIERLGLEISHLLLLQPTSPFRSADDSRSISSLLPSIGPGDSAVSVERVGDGHPARMYSTDGSSSKLGRLERLSGFDGQEFSPRQDLPPVYLRDGGFYVVGSQLAKQGFQLGSRPFFLERSWPYTLNIDSPRDLEEARRIARKFNL
jgi:CMP-N,N'-diacetyllegionaminic acid synthase